MIKILVTGAAGTIGSQVIKYLLAEGKYEITALDLKNAKVHHELKKYKRRVNIIYGDICDRVLIESLVKDHDYIIHLATVLPPLASLKKNLTKMIEFDALENIIRSINYYNPSVHLIYASTTSVYGDEIDLTVKSKKHVSYKEYFAYYKSKSEDLIKEKLKKYTILRLPLLVSSEDKFSIINNVSNKNIIDVVTDLDAAHAFIKCIDKNKEVNKKIINISSGEEFNMKFNDLITKINKTKGISYKYIFSNLFLEKNYFSNKCLDTDEFNKLLNYKIDTYGRFIDRLEYLGKKRRFSKLFTSIYYGLRGK